MVALTAPSPGENKKLLSVSEGGKKYTRPHNGRKKGKAVPRWKVRIVWGPGHGGPEKEVPFAKILWDKFTKAKRGRGIRGYDRPGISARKVKGNTAVTCHAKKRKNTRG